MDDLEVETNTDTSIPSYAEAYTNATKYMKVLYQDVNVLHHNITGEAFFSNHEELADMYEDIAEIIDALIENGMTIGLLEPSIEDSLKFKPSIEVKFRNSKETFSIIIEEFREAIRLMETAKQNVPDDIKNKIEEYENTLRIWAEYKANMYLA